MNSKYRIVWIVWIVCASIFSVGHHPLHAQDMENRLNPMWQKIVTIAAHTATGNLAALQTELNAGLDAGLTVNQIKEVLVQMYAYAGFPRSLQGIHTFMAVLEERKARGINDPEGPEASPVADARDKYTRGREILESLTHTDQKTLTGANAFAPAIDRFLKEHLFADIFERDVLTFQERELATISALAAMPGVDPMLQSHLRMGMNVGLSEMQLRQLVSIIGTSVHTQQGEQAGRILDRLSGKKATAASGTSVSSDTPKVRLSLITVDPVRLDEYNALLKEEIEVSMRVEPGVRVLYAVADRENPHQITILEMYAGEAAYQSHIQTPHFMKYKQDTLDMVQELELVDVDPLIPGLKIK